VHVPRRAVRQRRAVRRSHVLFVLGTHAHTHTHTQHNDRRRRFTGDAAAR
jgi:hypothetical protein